MISQAPVRTVYRAGAGGCMSGRGMRLPDDLRPLVELLAGRPDMTSAEVTRAAGVTLEEARRLWRALGFPPVPDDARVFTRADVAVLAELARVVERYHIEPGVLLQLTRVTGQALARIADAQVATLVARLDQDGAAPSAEALLGLAPLADHLERLHAYVWRRHLLAALLRRVASPTESADIVAVGFADLVGFTQLTQALEPNELAAMVERFEAIAYEQIPERGGRVVKTIGDEVMFAVDDVAAAAEIALGLVEAHARTQELPDVRVGLAHGPTLAWEGDLYGPTVNLASRLVNVARPATVIVSDDLRSALGDPPGFTLRPLRPVRLQGIGRVRTWVLRRAPR